MELVQELTQQLGINQQQASGGLGLLMREARSKLGGDFGQVAQHVPGVENMINSAPAAQSGGASTGGALGALGGLLGGGGGSGGAGALGSVGKLAGGFQQLGLSPSMIGRFLPIVLNFFQSRGGNQTRGLLEHAFA